MRLSKMSVDVLELGCLYTDLDISCVNFSRFPPRPLHDAVAVDMSGVEFSESLNLITMRVITKILCKRLQ